MKRIVLALVFAVSLTAQTPVPQHPTSQPYAGDLSIFETPGRDERLQIQRVMDLLQIKEGSTVAILAQVRAGSPRALRNVSAPAEESLRKTSTRSTSATFGIALRRRSCRRS